jgi:gamma-glutamyltranspeptidase/glutathione hydrolase
MVISLTSTIDSAFGSRIMVPETGLVLNDEMRDFSVPNLSKEFGSIPAPDNFIEPGKRPQSSITTVIVENSRTKKFYMATGGAGGTHIVTAVTQALWHVLDQQMTSLEAIKAPRLHDQLNPNQVCFCWSSLTVVTDRIRWEWSWTMTMGQWHTWLRKGTT